MSAIRIVELRSTYRDGGGPDKTILLSAQKHDRRFYDVRCVYLRDEADFAFSIGKRARSMGVPFEEVLENGAIDPVAWWRLARRIRRLRPDILHTHDYKSDILGLLLRPAYPRAAMLATAHGWTLDSNRMNLYNGLDRRFLSRYDHLIAVSRATRAHLLASGIPEYRLSVLYNGIDTADWRPGDRSLAAGALKKELGIPEGARLLGFIGRLSPEKDIPTAMAVAKRVLEDAPEVHLLVIGEGAEFPRLEALARSFGIKERSSILGYRPLSRQVYQALDLYYMTSTTEGLPNTLLESMACGVASVVTRAGGIPELLGESEAALQYAPGDVQGLSEGILRLLRDPATAEEMGQAARARIEDAFSFEKRLRGIERIYDLLANRRPLTPLAQKVGCCP